jgi:AcrR family transcriptional regulator
MQKRTKQEVVTEFRCSEILEAARKVFSERTFSEVTVDDIAAAAGMAKATVYQYFPSKQEIYLAALMAGGRKLLERTENALAAAQGGVRAKIEAFVRTRLEFLEENREFFAVYHAEFGNLSHPASINQEFRELYRRQFELLQSVLREGAKRGELADVSVETLAVVIYDGTKGLMLRRCLGWNTAAVDEQVAAMMQILWDGPAKKESPSP